MNDLVTSLIPLAIGSAVLPLQITVTILLVQSAAGRIAAVAWVSGMLVVRVAQGVVFGLLFDTSEASGGADGPGLIASVLLLVVAIVFLVSATRKLLKEPEDDEPSPRWISIVESASPGRAFLMGAGIVAISAKLWVLTLAAIGIVAGADLGQRDGVLVYLGFVAAALSIHLIVVGAAYLLPDRSTALFERASYALKQFNRPIMIGIGLVFGTWFFAKALDGLTIT
jgi:hypothetical protein